LRRSRRADFQADGAFAVAKHHGRDSREVAGQIVRQARLADLCSAAGVGGPGFINLVFSPELLRARLAEAAGDERLGIPTAAQPDTVVTDYATLIRRGVFEMPEKYGRNHISYSHTAADIDASLAIAEEALTAAFRTHTRPPS